MYCTIVSGASQNHYNTIINFIKSFIFYYHNIDNVSLVIYDLGINQDDWEKVRYMFRDENNIIWKKFDYLLYPSYLNININAGEYAWKPVILYDTCEEFKGIVIWMDSGNLILKRLDKFFNHISKNYIYSGESSGDIKKWTHELTLQYMNCDPSNYNLTNRNGACIGVNYEIDWVRTFVSEWKNLALTKECIAPHGSSRQNHRQDQAILTVLYYKYQKEHKFSITYNSHYNYSIHNDVD